MSDKMMDIYDGLKTILPLIEDHAAIQKEKGWVRLWVPIEQLEWMTGMMRTLHFHNETLMNQEKYDAFRKEEFLEIIGRQSKQLGIATRALEYIGGVPHNWEESYSNGYTTCLKKAFEALDQIKELEPNEENKGTNGEGTQGVS